LVKGAREKENTLKIPGAATEASTKQGGKTVNKVAAKKCRTRGQHYDLGGEKRGKIEHTRAPRPRNQRKKGISSADRSAAWPEEQQKGGFVERKSGKASSNGRARAIGKPTK